MSTPRLLCGCGVAAASRKTLAKQQQPRGLLLWARRYQSTKPSGGKRGFSLGRFTVYTITTTGLVAGGTLAYANYNPVFKNQVNEVVPGFAQWADAAADLFVKYSGSSRGTPVVIDRREGSWTGGGGSMSQGGTSGRESKKEVEENKETVIRNKKEVANRTDRNVDNQTSQHKKHETNLTENTQTTSTNQDAESMTGPKATEDTREREEAMEERKEDVQRVEKGSEDGRRKKDEVIVSPGSQEKETIVPKKSVVEEEKEAPREESRVEEEGPVQSKGDSEKLFEGTKDEVERAVEEVKGEVGKVAGEVREEKVREIQEAQMADEHLEWLRDSAEVESQLEEKLEELLIQTTKVEEAQRGLLKSMQEHSQLVGKITSSDDSSSDDALDNVYETGESVQKAEEAVSASSRILEADVENHQTASLSLSQLMDKAVNLGLKSKVAEIEEKVRECTARLAEGSTTLQRAEIDRKLLRDYHRRAQEDREQLQRELGRDLPEGDSRQEAVLVMLAKRVEILKEKLRGLEKGHQLRLTEALEQQRISLERLAERRLEWTLRDKESEMQQEFNYQADKIHREYQSELREQLRRQTDTHNRVLSEALDTQAEKLVEKWSDELELKLMEQDNHHQKQLALALSRLRGIEYVVNTIAAAGEETKRQQGMRAACDSLHTALSVASTSNDPHKYFYFQQEVTALRDVSRNDPFISAILNSIPSSAVTPENGIQGEGGLRERFDKVKTICRRVALVPEHGGGLGTYALSYLQSVLTVSWRFVGKVTRSSDDDKDVDKLDTFEILERADASIQQGDIDLAVRYVNLLRGVPRKVARDWLNDARSYLEMMQAVSVISEHMAALNISSSSSGSTTTTTQIE